MLAAAVVVVIIVALLSIRSESKEYKGNLIFVLTLRFVIKLFFEHGLCKVVLAGEALAVRVDGFAVDNNDGSSLLDETCVSLGQANFGHVRYVTKAMMKFAELPAEELEGIGRLGSCSSLLRHHWRHYRREKKYQGGWWYGAKRGQVAWRETHHFAVLGETVGIEVFKIVTAGHNRLEWLIGNWRTTNEACGSRWQTSLPIFQRSATFLVLDAQSQSVRPRCSMLRIFHSSTNGGAGEDDDGTWISRKSACEVWTNKKYPGSSACEFMGIDLGGEPLVCVKG